MRWLENKVVLVTGGAAGLGKSIAKRLAADGARVVITDNRSDVGRATSAECGFIFLEQDVCDETRWKEVVEEIEERCGHLNVLVNNAGILGSMEVVNPENTRLSEWKKIFAVNVEGVFLGCRTAIPAIERAGGGSIVNMSSIAGILATPWATAYGASKAAVRQLTKSVAQYCVQQKMNIRCNSVHPGNVRTPLWEKFAEEAGRARGVPIDDIFQAGMDDCPMGDFTLTDDVAAAVAFLASDGARHITGTQLIVDGGIVNCDTYHFPSRYAAAKSGIRS